MKKILSYVIVFLSVFIIWNYEVNAKMCDYSDGRMGATFKLKNNNEAKDAYIFGEMDSSDETEVDENQSVENWTDTHKDINFIGKNYYEMYNKCPPYAILVDKSGQFDLLVSDKSHLDDVVAYAKEKQGYAVMSLIGGSDDTESGDVETPEETPNLGSCAYYKDETNCISNPYYSCLWVKSEYGDYCNVDNLQYVQCANAFDIPHQVPELTSFGINFLKIITPIILIVTSIITLVKALMASKEDEIKKATGTLKRRLIAAALVFFVIYIVQFVIMKVADSSETEDISTCLSCFINNDCQNNIYYKTNVGGTYTCRYLKNKVEFDCPENDE